MGYPSKATGSINIEPPLTAAELRAHPELTSAPSDVGGEQHARWKDRRDAVILISAHRDITDDGEIVKLSGRKIVAGSGDADEYYSRRDFVRHLNEIIRTFPGRTYYGRIVLTYEEDGSQEAYVVHDGVTKILQPILTWPEESEATVAPE